MKTTKKRSILLRNPYGFEKQTKHQENPGNHIISPEIIKKVIDFIKESLMFSKICTKSIKIQENQENHSFVQYF